MAVPCSFLRASMASTVCEPYCSADHSGLPIPALVIVFRDSSRAVLRSGWQRIAHSCSRQQLSQRLARHIAQRMAADCSFFRSLTAFPTVCAPYCSADGSGLLILPLVNGFHDGVRAVLLSGWRPIAHSFSRQRLSRRFARCIAPRMAAHRSFFRLSPAFPTVCAPYCSADGSAFLLLLVVNGFHHSLRTVLLSGWQWIAHSSARQWLLRFARCISQ